MRTGVVLGGIELVLTYDTTPKLRPSTFSLTEPASFGTLWRTNFHHKLMVVRSNASALLSRGDGDVIRFDGGSGGFTATGNVAHRLAAVTGGYLFSDAFTGTLEMFDNAGTLQTLTTAGGMTLAFSYNGAGQLTTVAAADGRSLTFAYASGRITAVTGPDWSTLTPSYDVQGNLTGLTWPDGKTLGFVYENASVPWAMTGKVDENGSRYATFTFDSSGRATSTQHAGGAESYSVTYGTPPALIPSLTYDSSQDLWIRTWQWQAPGQTNVTFPNGSSSTLGAQVFGGRPSLTSRDQPAGSGCAATTSHQAYDAAGNVLSRDDFDGTRVCFAYDSANREITRVEGLASTVDCATVLPASSSLPGGARKITTTWHPDWSMPTAIVEPLKKITIIYHGQPDPFNGNALANCTSTPARVDGKAPPVVCKRVEQPLMANGSVDSTVPARTTSYSYDSFGRVLTATDPKLQTTTNAYYNAYAFDGVDPLFKSTALLLHADAANGSTVFTNSAPSGKIATPSGDAKISTAQSRFGSSSISFDGNGDYLTLAHDGAYSGNASEFTYEAFIRPANITSLRLIFSKRLNNTEWVFFINTDGTVRAVAWDGTGNVVLNFGTTTTLALNTWAHVALSKSGGVWRIFLNGVLSASATATGTIGSNVGPLLIGRDAVVPGQRDFAGYMDEIRITTGKARYTASFTPPAAPFLDTGPNMNAVGHTQGDLQSVTNAVGQVTQYTQYDPSGRVRQMIDPKGITTDITYTPRGWVNTVTVTPPVGSARTTTYTYDNAGQMTGVALPDGTSLSYAYDAAHRLTGVTDTLGNSITYTLDASGNRTGEDVRDAGGALRRSISRSYDALNRLQQVTGASQ